MIKNKIKNNSSFVLTVCLMVALIVLTIPTAMAWFTDKVSGNSTAALQFGKVNIETKDETTVFTATLTRGLNNLLPGDTINFTSQLTNENGTVAAYAGVGSYLKLKYTPNDGAQEDITTLFQPYIEITPLSIDSDSIVDGTESLALLEVDEIVDMTGSIKFSNKLPNALGDNGEYVLNGQQLNFAKIELELHILVSSIQKDNITDLDTAESEIKKLIYGDNIEIAGATINDISLESFTYLKSYIDNNHNSAIVLATADVTSTNNTLTIDVSDLNVETGEKVTVLHYNELEKIWETVGTYTVSDELTINATFTSLSPIALIKYSDEHQHTYENSRLYYEVINGEAYTFKYCGCGEKSESTKLENAVVATPATAQNILDSNINGKTVVFAEGEYGSLILRPSLATVSEIYEYNKLDAWDLSTPTVTSNLNNTSIYHYVRYFENVTFAGTENAVFKGLFSSQSKEYMIRIRTNTDIGLSNTNEVTDIIRGITINYPQGSNYATTRFVDHNRINGMSFVNMNFEGDKGRIYFFNQYNDKIDNLSFNYCTFITDTYFNGWGAIKLEYYTPNENRVDDKFDNVILNNVSVDGHYHGVYIMNCNNPTVINSNFKNCIYGICIQGYKKAGPKGNILIQNNIVDNCLGASNTGERGIRFGECDNANIIIKNNKFINAVDSDNELLKTDSSTNTKYTFENNSHNGIMIDNENGTINSTKWIVTVD